MTLRELVGVRLKEARLERNLTQKDLAKLLNYERSYITLLENGKRSLEINKLESFANVLNKSISYFIEGY